MLRLSLRPVPAADAPSVAAATVVAPKPPAKAAPGAVVAEITQGGDDLRVKFPFGAPTPAAVFRRADTLWVVFDTKREMDVQALNEDSSQTVRNAEADAAG